MHSVRPAPALVAPPRTTVVVALAVVYLVWGSTYLAFEVAIGAFPPLLLLAGRFALAGAVLFVVARRRERDPLTWAHWWQATVTGGLLLVGGTGMIALGQTGLPSGTVALLVSTVPIFLAVFARVVCAERLGALAWSGLALGLVGIAVLVGPGGGAPGPVLVVLFGAAAWAAGSLRGRRTGAPAPPMAAAAMEMLAASLLFAVLGVARGEAPLVDLAEVGPAAWWSFGYLVVGGSLVAYTAYSWLLRHVRTTVVGTYAYVNPVVAVLLGWAVLGERVSGRTLAAGALVLTAVVLLIVGRAGRPLPAQVTSGGDVFAGASRRSRRRDRVAPTRGRVPRPVRPGRPPPPRPGPLLRRPRRTRSTWSRRRPGSAAAPPARR